MIPLFLILHILIGTALSGSAVVVALTLGLDTLWPLLIAAGLGFVVAFPVSWLVARELHQRVR